eukprot:516811-Amorphochlora_amoeboformis.AAC.1
MDAPNPPSQKLVDGMAQRWYQGSAVFPTGPVPVFLRIGVKYHLRIGSVQSSVAGEACAGGEVVLRGVRVAEGKGSAILRIKAHANLNTLTGHLTVGSRQIS